MSDNNNENADLGQEQHQINLNNMQKIYVFKNIRFGQISIYNDIENARIISAKTYNKYRLLPNDEYSRILQNEIDLLTRFDHPCVLSIIGYSFQSPNQIQIISKYTNNSSLSKILYERENGGIGQYLNDTWVAITIVGIVLGMKYIHSKNLTHGDLKPENILFNEKGMPLISDFYNYEFIDKHLIPFDWEKKPIYIAPELLFEPNKNPTHETDVYSFSIILYELLSKKSIVPKNMKLDQFIWLVKDGFHPEIPDSINLYIRNIISRCWDIFPSMRLSFEEIYQKIKDWQQELENLLTALKF